MATRHELMQQVEALKASERGALHKSAPLKVALCYPSPYRVGMSSLGFQTMYREINGHRNASAERCFLPEDIEAFRGSRVPLFTFESLSPVSSFPLLAFSVAYELELAGLIEMLELAGLCALREERSDSAPLVVAGGPLTFSNSAPLEPFVDVIVQGEADELIHRLLDVITACTDKRSVLDALNEVPGFFVPGATSAVSRHFVARADNACLPARSQVIAPDAELRSMFLIEPERGCSRGCHYCVMRRSTNGGMRLVPKERILSLIPEDARRVGLVGAAVTDHPAIVELVETLVATGRQVGVSSLRADRLSARLVGALKAGGARVLTIASDGASQRLRDLVERRHTEEQILRAAQLAREAKLERLKVYNMVGLPLETDADLGELVRFSCELSRILPLALGVAPFVAKRHTPLDGAPFAGIAEIDRRLDLLRRGLKGRVSLRPTSSRWAWVEYLLAQRGPEAGLAALEAHREGGRFAAWKRAFARHCPNEC